MEISHFFVGIERAKFYRLITARGELSLKSSKRTRTRTEKAKTKKERSIFVVHQHKEKVILAFLLSYWNLLSGYSLISRQ